MDNGEDEPLSREEIQGYFPRLEAQERDIDAREKVLGDRFEKEGLDNPFTVRPTTRASSPSPRLETMPIADARRWYSSRSHQLIRRLELFVVQQDLFMLHLHHVTVLSEKVLAFLLPLFESGGYELCSTNPKVKEERVRLIVDAATGYWDTFPEHERTETLTEHLIGCLEEVMRGSIDSEYKTLFYEGFRQSL